MSDATDKSPADALTAMADDMRAEQTYLGSCRESCDNSGRIRWDRLQRVIDHLAASPVEQPAAAPMPRYTEAMGAAAQAYLERVVGHDPKLPIFWADLWGAMLGAAEANTAPTQADERIAQLEASVQRYRIMVDELKQRLHNVTHPEAPADERADGRAAFEAEWMLVKRKRIDEIKRYAYTKFEESYQGRGLYDESAVHRNANLGEEMLTNIQSELEWIDEDAKDFAAEHAASANETGAEAVGIVHSPAHNGQDFSVEWLKSPPTGKLYAAPQPAQANARVGLTDALRRAREELSIVEWENDPPSRVVKLFDEIDALLHGANQS
ncbi:hypothetical protein [Burkholderia cenocepacia]|uniref:hypothetical protein n=1 Tax=Burkholderia cenocepacia TaxID=95486 RepID=UPI001BA1540E|nr:hypothetical protein [Burkholderia cenocepacia]MBR8426200.1 hypothetical protein [Burkholderia cenocepacia]